MCRAVLSGRRAARSPPDSPRTCQSGVATEILKYPPCGIIRASAGRSAGYQMLIRIGPALADGVHGLVGKLHVVRAAVNQVPTPSGIRSAHGPGSSPSQSGGASCAGLARRRGVKRQSRRSRRVGGLSDARWSRSDGPSIGEVCLGIDLPPATRNGSPHYHNRADVHAHRSEKPCNA